MGVLSIIFGVKCKNLIKAFFFATSESHIYSDNKDHLLIIPLNGFHW